jgi:hypothetical protein
MGIDLELTASRFITVNKTGKVETQSYSINVITFTDEECEAIVNSNDPYEKYCSICKKHYTDLEPVYIWEVVNDLSEYVKDRLIRSFLLPPEKQDIIRYKTHAESVIESLDMDIKQALDNSYELKWWISY